MRRNQLYSSSPLLALFCCFSRCSLSFSELHQLKKDLEPFPIWKKSIKKLYSNRVGIYFGFSHLVHVLDGLDQRRAERLREEECQQAAKNRAAAHEEERELVKGEGGEVQGNLDLRKESNSIKRKNKRA